MRYLHELPETAHLDDAFMEHARNLGIVIERIANTQMFIDQAQAHLGLLVAQRDLLLERIAQDTDPHRIINETLERR